VCCGLLKAVRVPQSPTVTVVPVVSQVQFCGAELCVSGAEVVGPTEGNSTLCVLLVADGMLVALCDSEGVGDAVFDLLGEGDADVLLGLGEADVSVAEGAVLVVKGSAVTAARGVGC
jgi:hypothetical protein